MIPGQGYAVLAPTTPVITLQNPTGYNYDINFVGEANNGIINVPTWKNDSFAGGNFNLVGNPYPSAIDLDKLFAVNTNLIYPFAGIWGRTPVDGVTPSSGPYGYLNYFNPDNYCIYSPTMTIPSGNSTFTNILSSCQAFFVKTIKDAPSQLLNTGAIQPAGNLIFNNSMRTTNTDNTFVRMANNNNTANEKTKIWIAIKETSNDATIETGIAFLDKGDDKFNENEDVKCFYGNPLNIYTIADKTDLVINALSKFEDDKMIALGFNNFTESNRLTISIAKTTGELADHEVYLMDKKTSKIVNISKESYNFVSESKTDDTRFTILFQNKLSGELGDTDNNKVIIFAKDGIVTVNSLTDKKIQSVYVSDIYTPSIGGIEIAKSENINNKQYRFTVDKERYKLLNITVVLEDGTIVNKKVMP